MLPCGAKIFISYSGAEVLTEVIDTKLKQPGRQFELTEALAQRLGIEGTQQIRWRFATQTNARRHRARLTVLDPVRGLARKREPTLT